MRARVIAIIWVTLVWVGLWESLSLAAIVSGVVVAVVLVYGFPMKPRWRLDALRPLGVLYLLGYFVAKMFQANAVVAWEVITPGHERVNEGIVAVPLDGASGPVISLLAIWVSLTPGTLVIEVQKQPAVMYVHVLHMRSIRQVRLDLLRLEQVIAGAIASEQGQRAVEARIAAQKRLAPEETR